MGRAALHGPTMLAAALLNQPSARCLELLFERVLMLSRPDSWAVPFDGKRARLTRENFRDTALATGSVPMYFEPVQQISGAPPGRYLDGGLTDYHLRQQHLARRSGLVLFPHFQERIVPNWFDRWNPRRRPSAKTTDNLLQIFPSDRFLEHLPGGRIPTRQDFVDFADDAEMRITRWLQVVRESDRLGELLVDDVEQGRIGDLVEPMR